MKAIKAIVFDFDDTLADRGRATYYYFKKIVKEVFVEMDENSIEFDAIVQDLITTDEFGTCDRMLSYAFLEKKYGVSKEIIQDLAKRWPSEFFVETVLFPETKSVLTELRKKYKLGIITNGHSASQWAKLKKVDIIDCFDEIIVSGDGGIHKPDKRIFDEMAKRLDLEPSECAFVGDTYSADILGAHKAGFKPVWICPNVKRFSTTEVMRIHKIEDLLDLF